MKPSLSQKLQQLVERLNTLDQLMMDPNITNDMNQYRKIMKENADIKPVVEGFLNYQKKQSDLTQAFEMLNDAELKEWAQEEIEQLKPELETQEFELQCLLLPKDPNDDKNVIVEIRAGAGGDESALFAADLLRMYTRYAERQGWQLEAMSESASDLGGFKEVIIRIAGFGAYSKLKFESGGHRVQRVPQTEAQGRIHTSACTVAVMPEADELAAIEINPSELRVDTFRASGAGGQHVNKTDSAIRITHLPSGLVVECQDDRSQHRNRDKAMKVLVTRLQDMQIREQQAKESSTRKSLVGTGDRSDRIRTYNFPQGRISDHRINLTLYKIDAMMDGDIQELLDSLAAEHQAERLANLSEEE
jgi:peptide chain release factor 1